MRSGDDAPPSTRRRGRRGRARAPSVARAARPPRRPQAEIDADNDDLFAAIAAEPGARRWQWIVVHHTAAEFATLDGIDRYHRAHFGDPLGAEYHFVIGNGKKTELGRCEAARWRHQQALAAHLFHPERAPDALALCLIGNFHERPVPTAMMDGLAGLCRSLMTTFAIPLDQVTTHRKVDVGLTACPGKHFDLDDLRKRVEAG
ncbi:MAG: peptidoglycan recognition family protein [Nannocystaceae bacterium]